MTAQLLSVMLLLTLGAMTQSQAASFDCQRVSTITEKTICNDLTLNDADVKMATSYQILRKLLPMGGRSLIQEEQSKWIQLREQCQDNLTCLNEVYKMRQQKLEDYLQRIYQRGPF